MASTAAAMTLAMMPLMTSNQSFGLIGYLLSADISTVTQLL
nr:MAG TPA: hypothetical protein [Caudoviricetes sp.]